MKNLKNYNNIWEILTLFINDSFHGVLNRPIFKSKFGRISIISSFFLAYFYYFYINAVEFARLGQNRNDFTLPELAMAIKLSISSYNNLSFIVGIFIFQLSQSIILIKESSLFTARMLPFLGLEIKYAIHLFKLVTSIVIYELCFIIMMPGLQVIGDLPISVLLFFSCHCSFLVGYMASHSIYNFFNKYFNKYFSKIKGVISFVILTSTMFYFYIGRFRVEFFLAKHIQPPIYLAVVSFLVMLIICLLLFLIPYDDMEESFLGGRYLHIPLPRYLTNVLKSVLRTKLCASSLFIFSTLVIYSCITTDFNTMIKVMSPLYPFLNIMFLHYADSTLQIRKLYNLMGLSVKREWLEIVMTILIFQIPLLLVEVLFSKDFESLLWGVSLSIVSVIVGFLFPKSESSLNEVVSVILLLLSIIILITIKSSIFLIVTSLVILSLLLFYILIKERGIKYAKTN
ncbi:hypothetical protein ABPS01_07695 [Streptococcus sp. ZJ151]|uniref:hypothetical protein n=1 Tax=Streptococcus jiangjianxini TaxID=3161189 RepID=UPI0032F016D1